MRNKMFEQIIRHKYFFHIVASIVILTVAILFIVFSGNSAKTDYMTNTIKTTVGKKFVITMDANATTGYEWQLANPIDDNLIKLVSSIYNPYKTGRLGSGGKSIWTFKAVRAGKTQISFKYIRPWEKNTRTANETTYIVTIQDKRWW